MDSENSGAVVVLKAFSGASGGQQKWTDDVVPTIQVIDSHCR